MVEVKEDCTLRLSNLCIGRNLLTKAWKFINVYILERKFHQNYVGDIQFLPKITIFEKITQKNPFSVAIFFRSRLEKKFTILKIAFEMFY